MGDILMIWFLFWLKLWLVKCVGTPSPNIVFILADDLGYNELGYMNTSRGLITPEIDDLANNGIVLKQYYAQPICSPTRSALMTGRYTIRLGTQGSVIYWDTPWGISLNETFMPELLKSVGYTTAMFGKWHLGMYKEDYCPWKRGFDQYMGYLQGCESAYTHIAACCKAGSPTNDSDYICPAKGNKDYRGYDWFQGTSTSCKPDFTANHTNSATLIRNAAVKFLKQQSLMNSPFYLYLPFQNVHGPHTCDAKYRAPYAKFPDKFTAEEMTLFGYITELDTMIGSIVSELKTTGLYNNTIIIFSSDNGGPRGKGLRGRNWPLRGFKTEIWEGGTRVPGFVHSPLIPTKSHGVRDNPDQLYHITDWFPTIAGLAGLPISITKQFALDGYSIWNSILHNKASPRKEMLYNINPLCNAGQAHAPKAGLRIGEWKLLSYCYQIKGIHGSNSTGPITPSTTEIPPPQSLPFLGPNSWPMLFNLTADPSETINLAPSNPDVVTKLLQRMAKLANGSVEPMQWDPPYQGNNYSCAKCSKRPATGPYEAWTPWM